MHQDLIDFWKEAPEDPFDALLAHAPVLMQAVDEEGRIQKVSRFWSELLGHAEDDLAGRDWRDLLTPASRKIAETRIAPDLLRTGRSQPLELDFLRSDGTVLPVVHAATLMLDKNGRFLRAFAILFDNRPTVEAREKLETTAREAEEASRAKSRFLAAMSHEIRTPLNAILGFAQLLELSNLDEKRSGHVQAIIRAGGALMNLLTDLLDLSQVEEGRMRIEPKPFDLIEMLDQVADWWHSSARQKGIRLNVSLDRDLPRRVEADSVRLQQVLNNFLGNAVKFTAEGSVTLRVVQTARDSDTARIRFEVEDTGPGMRPEEREKLFKPFVQIDTDFGKDRGGWGLGLSICANIAKRMDAKIAVESAPGEGSVFAFEVTMPVPARPVRRRMPGPPRPTRPGKRRSLHILLAEDDPPNQDLMRNLLSQMGHDVTAVNNGFEAVAATFDDPYDLVLMDVMMPGLDGVEATRAIRSAENPLRDIPIIACSANVAEDAQRRYLKAGMTDFLPKPVDRTRLAEMIAEVTEPPPAGPS